MMPDDVLQGHQPLYGKLKELHDELSEIEYSVKNNEKQFFSLIRNLQQVLDTQSVDKSGSEPLRQFYSLTLEQISLIVDDWVKRIEKYELNTSFRKHYGDSLLIYVYGKVKAGKSSLGNFIAYGQEKVSVQRREQLKKEGHDPQFFIAEKGEHSIEDTTHHNGFYVDSAEATSCIQGFTLPGLTWIDSPGIHSVTPENQALAQKYVESADLIIYPMNSAQPGRRTDMQEIRELILRRKRLLLLITRCDEKESDEDDEGNVITFYQMKSDRNRTLQAEYVSKEFIALCDELNVKDIDFEVLTLSVRYTASQGNTPDVLHESGAQGFINKLITTIQSEGVQLKKNVPHNALQAFYRLLLSSDEEKTSIDALMVPLNQLSERILNLQSDLNKRCEEVKAIISNDISLKVTAYVEDYTQHRDPKKLENEIIDAVRRLLESKLSPVIDEVTDSLVVDINQMVGKLNFKNKIKLDAIHQSIDIDTSGRNAVIGGTIGAVVVGSLAFVFSGGLAGTAGGITGQTIGNFLGGKVKTSRKVQIAVGDNRLVLAERLSEMAIETVESTIERTRLEVNKHLLNPMKRTVDDLVEQVDKIRSWAMEYEQKEQ